MYLANGSIIYFDELPIINLQVLKITTIQNFKYAYNTSTIHQGCEW